ncbi:MAG: glycosyltransferase family 4 protein [Planctomycetes bacterium]|nr:glycosyltransferase family 4 protein [Planctomycetota bacterium]
MAFHDHRIMADNLTALPQPYYPTTLRALRHLLGIAIAMWRTCRRSDVLFVRGSVPYVGVLYAIATLLGKRIHYWAVGDPAALLRSHRRSGRVKDMLSLIYAIMDSYTVRFGHFVNRGAIFANGDELARLFPSSRTHTVVSSTIRDEEFFERTDTCTGNTVRILCLSMIRPEKGIEYLLGAMDMLRTNRDWEVVIVGSWDGFEDYKARLDRIVTDSPWGKRMRWAGYANGSEVLAHMRNADVFVLPTLSEGTPRVLVEARAQSLPIVSTRVGGIATSVSDGVDGLLVAPKNPAAIALAVDRIIDDAPLRRRLIANGLTRARTLTLDRFLERILAVMGNEPT